MDPLGLRMEKGCCVGSLFMTGVSMVQKCAVLPVLAMSVVAHGWSIGFVGGPIIGVGSDDETRVVG